MITSDLTAWRKLAMIGAVALALIVSVGCGSSSSSSSKTTATTSTNTSSQPTTTSTTPSTTAAEDQRIASDAQLKLTDFPSGWEQQDNAQQSKSEAKCQSVDAAKAAASAREKSPTFTKGEGTQAQDAVYIYADVPSATREFGQLSGESTRLCIADQLGKALASEKQQGVEVGKITTGQVSMAPVGDESALGRLTIPLKSSGLNVDAYADLVFVRAGRGIATMQFLDVLSPFDEALRNKLTTTVVDRLKTALAQSP